MAQAIFDMQLPMPLEAMQEFFNAVFQCEDEPFNGLHDALRMGFIQYREDRRTEYVLYETETVENVAEFTDIEKQLLYSAWIILLLKKIDEREAKIVWYYYGLGGTKKTLRELGVMCNISRSRVWQVKYRALLKMHHPKTMFERSETNSSHSVTTSILPNAEVMSLTKLGLSNRPERALLRARIMTIGDLIEKTPVELMQAPNFGTNCLEEVLQTLADFNLRLSTKNIQLWSKELNPLQMKIVEKYGYFTFSTELGRSENAD